MIMKIINNVSFYGKITDIAVENRRMAGIGKFDGELICEGKMTSESPARLMGLNKGKIEVGYGAHFVIADEDFNLVKAIARGGF